jgi:hypothetical protein
VSALPQASPALIVVNDYEITSSSDRFADAISALAARVEAEGHPGVRTYQFFIATDGRRARAIIRYDGPEAWIGHHEISFPWDEMRAMHATARLSRVAFLGPFTDAMREWLARSPLSAEIVHYDRKAAGFERA